MPHTFRMFLFTNYPRVRRVKTKAANLVGRLGLFRVALETSFVFEDLFIKPCCFGKIGLRMRRGATRCISNPNPSSLVLKHRYHINDEYLTGIDMVSTSEDASPRETKDRKLLFHWPYSSITISLALVSICKAKVAETTTIGKMPAFRDYPLTSYTIILMVSRSLISPHVDTRARPQRTSVAINRRWR
jgi:hypothetical protein